MILHVQAPTLAQASASFILELDPAKDPAISMSFPSVLVLQLNTVFVGTADRSATLPGQDTVLTDHDPIPQH